MEKVPVVKDKAVTLYLEEYEEYLIELGHKLGNCEWMVHKNPQVITK